MKEAIICWRVRGADLGIKATALSRGKCRQSSMLLLDQLLHLCQDDGSQKGLEGSLLYAQQAVKTTV